MCLGLGLMDFFTTNLLEFSRMWWTMEPWVDGFFLDRMNRRDRIFLGLSAWVVCFGCVFLTTEDTEITELG